MQIFVILIHIFCRYDDLRSELERERMQSDRFQVEIAELQRQFALEILIILIELHLEFGSIFK